MRKTLMLAGALVVLGVSLVAADMVRVPGSSTSYPSTTEVNVAGKSVKLALTGTALRTKLIVNVYAIGSYVQEGVKVRTAEELAAVDCPKQLHLVMERTVDGKDMAEAFRSAIRMNYSEPAFNDEIQVLTQYLQSTKLQKGEQIYLTHVPGVGLDCNLAGKTHLTIKSQHFSQAVWEIYLGKRNLGESIKRGLTSRL
jgi:Chalcone isomerase-like